MLDKIDKINFNSNLPTPKGHYCVQLFDAETNELIREEHHDNMFNTEIGVLFHENALYQLLYKTNGRYRETYYPASPRFLRLANFEVEPYPTIGYPSSMSEIKAGRGYFIGHGELSKTSNDDSYMSYNATESNVTYYLDDNGVFRKRIHWVFDAATNQCNGTISSLFLSGDESYGGCLWSLYYMGNNDSKIGCYVGLNSLIPGVPSWVANADVSTGCASTPSIDEDGNMWLFPVGPNYNGWEKYDGVENIPTFFAFDRNFKFIGSQSLQLPSELLNTYLRGYKVGNKFFVLSFTSNSIATTSIVARNVHMFNSNGVYEGIAPSQIYVAPGSYFSNMYGTPFGLLYCSPTLGAAGNTTTKLQGGILGVNGNHLWLYQRADNLDNLHQGTKYKGYPYFSIIRDEGKWYVGIMHDIEGGGSSYRTTPMAYYEVETGKIIKISNTYGGALSPTYSYNPWYSDYGRYSFNISYEGMQYFNYQGGGVRSGLKNSFISWCKLDSPVTKTSNTTMKIQYDFDVPFHNYLYR